MDLYIRENGMLIDSMGKDPCIIQIKTNMKANFLMENSMVMGHISIKLEINMKEIGRMVK